MRTNTFVIVERCIGCIEISSDTLHKCDPNKPHVLYEQWSVKKHFKNYNKKIALRVGRR